MLSELGMLGRALARLFFLSACLAGFLLLLLGVWTPDTQESTRIILMLALVIAGVQAANDKD